MKKFRRKLPLIAIAMLAITALIGGTFAYFSQSSSASNFLKANAYNSTLTETFTPPQDGNFTPGVEVDKVVGVTNTGDVGMLVRIKYEEFWGGTPVALTYADPILYEPVVSTGEPTAVEGYYFDTGAPSAVLKEAGYDPTTSGTWKYGGDSYYYYLSELNSTEATDSFITSIMLKMDTMDSITTYSGYYWDAINEAYVPFADLTTKPTNADAVIAVGLGAYVSSVIENTEYTFTNDGVYELKFTVDTVQSVDAAATDWIGSASVTEVETFLAGFQMP
jgi:alternate signal-mediated exported protein